MPDYTVTLVGAEDTLGDLPFPAPSGFYLEGIRPFEFDYYFGGVGRIAGTVREKSSPSNLPLIRRVTLFHQKSGARVSEMWSNAAGEYAFECLDTKQTFFVVAFDYLGNYRGVVADNLVPVAS